MSILNERIKERRLSLGLTLLDVADKLGVKEATVQRYESGDIKNIKHETIVQLSEILNCSPSYLMGWQKEKTDNEKLLERLKAYAEAFNSLEQMNELEKYFKCLNFSGRVEALKRVKELTFIPSYCNSEDDNNSKGYILNAAHEVEDASAEDKAYDEELIKKYLNNKQ